MKKQKEQEAQELIEMILEGRISRNELTDGQFLNVRYQAKKMIRKGVHEIHLSLLDFPGTTFDCWGKQNADYKKGLYIIEWLVKNRNRFKHRYSEQPKAVNGKDGYNSKEWCAILYYSDYSEKTYSDKDTDIVEAFRLKHDLPFAKTSFLTNFKAVKKQIEGSEKPSIRILENILPYFKNKNDSELIENELSIIKDTIDRQK
jgi:hypothetical protein